MITGSVFNEIFDSLIDGKIIMYGHFGISKTISCILYSYLSNLIIRYLIKSENLNDSKNLAVPKLIYWTIQTKNFQRKAILDNIVRQFKEI